MKKIEIVPFKLEDSELWDSNIESSSNYCFMGSQKFISYHKNRFVDRSTSVLLDGSWIGSFPAAEDPNNSSFLISYPGATFGGLYFKKELRGEEHSSVLKEILKYYKNLGFKKIFIRPVPSFYREYPIEDDFYALSSNGALIDFCRPTCTISLQGWGNLPPTKGRKSTRNKSFNAGVEIHEGWKWLDAFWMTLEENLKVNHLAKPVHTLEEIKTLIDRFSDSMVLYVGVKNSSVLAGALCFLHRRVVHTQYLSNTPLGRELSVLDAIINHAITKSKDNGFAFFDFGTSQKQDGLIDESLYFYKQSFGAGSFCHWSFQLQL